MQSSCLTASKLISMAAEKENPAALPPPPLYRKFRPRNTIQRLLAVTLLILLTAHLLIHRLAASFNSHHGLIILPWQLLDLLCESCFLIYWLITISTKWSPLRYRTYLDNLYRRFSDQELPAVDMFVTTADPVAEPPIITVNTVLSLLALDYPADKLACYVSDDGCSALTFYALRLAADFAQIWVPFCKRHAVQTRAPFRYFSGEAEPPLSSPASFQQEWETIKDEYEKVKRKIEEAAAAGTAFELTGDYDAFADATKDDHPTIVKVIRENKRENSGSVPHLVYISREKRPNHHHHYKAGAMNVLMRVSGVMTNAAYMLNVDCDMYANNPSTIGHAMCLLLEPANHNQVAFVQCPQVFYDAPKDDPFGNQLVVFYRYIIEGISGIQGPFYGGSGCFHRRKVIYGLTPHDTGELVITGDEGRLVTEFGGSGEFIRSVAEAFKGTPTMSSHHSPYKSSLKECLEAAFDVAGCAYENASSWGTKVGWRYGSTSEDILTGMVIHANGWKSMFCTPEPVAFLGCAPTGGPASMTQQKRWASGLLEILVTSSSNRLIFGRSRLQFRQRLAYLWVLTWGLRPLPELCYALLPAYSIITGNHFLPKVSEPTVLIPAAIFVFYNLQTLLEYIGAGLSVRAWWNNQRMARVTSTTAWFFGFLSVLLKRLGLSETVFEITRKDNATDSNDDTSFTFDESPMFIPSTALLLLHLAALSTIPLRLLLTPAGVSTRLEAAEILSSVCIVLCFWPFLKGLFGRGKYGIPLSTIFKSAALALVFAYLCQKNPR